LKGRTLGNNSVLKGRGFQPRRKYRRIQPALAAEAAFGMEKDF